MSPPSMVSSQMVRKILGAAAVMGADLRGLQEAVGLAPEVVVDAEGRVPVEVCAALFDEAARRAGDEAFGLHVAELARRQPDNLLAFALQSSPTLGEAYRRAGRYVRLVNDTLEIQVHTRGAVCWLVHRQHHPVGGGRHGVECSMAMLFLFARQAFGAGFRLHEVSFRHERPASTAEHGRIFEAPVEFGQAENAISFARELLELPMPAASERFCRHLDLLIEELLAALPRRGGVAEQVRAALAADLRGAPSLEGVAGRLGMTARSLQRRLSAEGASYNEILDELRHELALRYLEQESLALAEVAFLLGFAEQSAFHRAFRRWRAATPAEWRRGARKGAALLR